MAFVSGLRCRECSREYPGEALNVCDFCFGPLEVVYDYATIAEVVSHDRIAAGPLSIWRYHDLLPASGDDPVDIMAGFTPLLKARNLGERLGLKNLYIKNDSVNPSFSFKDRVVSVAATKAREFGFETIACASTGNLACSVAAHAARAGMQSVVFIPSDLERGKVIGAAVYGPTMVAVEGTYDEVNRLCSEVGDNYPWAFVNINMRPYYAEGSKTLGYEVAEQLDWRIPDHVVIPSASGAMFTKIWEGLQRTGLPGPAGRRGRHDLWPRPEHGPPSRHHHPDAHGSGRGLRAHRQCLGRRPRPRLGRCARTASPSPWPSAIPPTAFTPCGSSRSPTVRPLPSPNPRWWRASSCWPRPRVSSPRPPAA